MLRHAIQRIYSAFYPPNKLMSLPPEIWIAILQHLSPPELARTFNTSRNWHALAREPVLWSSILLAGKDPAIDIVILRYCLALAGDTPISVEVHTDGERQEAESSAGHEPTSRILHVLSAHSWHIKHLVLHLRTFSPRDPNVELPVEDIRDYLRHGALKHFLKKPKPVLETCAISMRWDHIEPAVPRLFKFNAPRLSKLRLSFGGGVEQLPDPSIFPSVQHWHFDGRRSTIPLPWDWDLLWPALEERGYLDRQEVVFTQIFDPWLDPPNVSPAVCFNKWETRRIKLWEERQVMSGQITLTAREHAVRLEIFFNREYLSRKILGDAAAMELVEDLELNLHTTSVITIFSPNVPMPHLRRLSIVLCMADFTMLIPKHLASTGALLSPNLEEVRVKRSGIELNELVKVNSAWLASFLSQRIQAGGQRFPLLRLDMRSGLQFEEGFDIALKVLTDCADAVVVD